MPKLILMKDLKYEFEGAHCSAGLCRAERYRAFTRYFHLIRYQLALRVLFLSYPHGPVNHGNRQKRLATLNPLSTSSAKVVYKGCC